MHLTELDNLKPTKNLGWLCGVYLADGCLPGKNMINICKLDKSFENELNRLGGIYGFNLDIKYKMNTIKNKGIETKYDDRVYEGKNMIFAHKTKFAFIEEIF